MIVRRSALVLAFAVLGCGGRSESTTSSSHDEPTEPTEPTEPPTEAAPEPNADPPRARGYQTLALGSDGCWIRDDGQLVCFGYDADGSLGGAVPGVPYGELRTVPGLRDLVSIAGFGDRHCAVDVTGKVWCFGSIGMSHHNDWSRTPPWGARAMHHDYLGFADLAVDAEGRLMWWGKPDLDSAWSLVDGTEGIVEFAFGYHLGCGRTDADVVYCSTLPKATYRPLQLARIEGIEAPTEVSPYGLVRNRAGDVYNVDPPSRKNGWEVARVDVSDVVDLQDRCGLHSNGAVTCGLNTVPWVIAEVPPARAIVPSDDGVCLIAASDDSVYCERYGREPRRVRHLSPARALVAYGDLWCALVDEQLRCVNQRHAKLAVPELRGEELLASYRTLCVRSGGRVRCWQKAWELDDEHFFEPPLDDAVGLQSFNDLPCARRADDSLLCLDHLRYGELSSSPVGGLAEVAEVALGYGFACARERSGKVRCWGVQAEHGQLGDGRGQADLTPSVVLGIDDAIDIDAGNYRACALRSNGEVLCWGLVPDATGTTTTVRTTPVLVHRFDDAVQVTLDPAGNRPRDPDQPDGGGRGLLREFEPGLCVRHRGGRVSCIGIDLDCEQPDQRHEPVAIAGITEAVHSSGGYQLFCALEADGDVACWRSGEPGCGAPVPTRFEIEARGLAVGGDWLCADIEGERGPTCWGLSDYGPDRLDGAREPGISFPFTKANKATTPDPSPTLELVRVPQ